MLVLEGTYENGHLHLDQPVVYRHPVRVRVEFLDELEAATIGKPRFSWDEALALSDGSGAPVSDAVLEERREAE